MKQKKYINVGYSSKSEDGTVLSFSFTLQGELNLWIEEFLENPGKSKLGRAFMDNIKACWESKDYVED